MNHDARGRGHGECPERGRLDAWIDGELSADDRDAFVRHLSGCPACAADARHWMSIRGWATGLPSEVAPERDLWPEIAASLPARARPARPARGPVVPVVWAVAAALLLAAGTGIVASRWSPPPPPLAEAAPAPPEGAPWEREFLRANAELNAELDVRRSELDPETLAVVERNLAIIDEALAETREALAKDPADAPARRALARAHSQRIRLLQRVLEQVEG